MLCLELALQHSVKDLMVCGDLRIIVGQVMQTLNCHQASLQIWLDKTTALKQQFHCWENTSYCFH